MVEVQKRKRMNKISSQNGRRKKMQDAGIQPTRVKGEEKNACIVVFIIWLLSFCSLCKMKARDERERRGGGQ